MKKFLLFSLLLVSFTALSQSQKTGFSNKISYKKITLSFSEELKLLGHEFGESEEIKNLSVEIALAQVTKSPQSILECALRLKIIEDFTGKVADISSKSLFILATETVLESKNIDAGEILKNYSFLFLDQFEEENFVQRLNYIEKSSLSTSQKKTYVNFVNFSGFYLYHDLNGRVIGNQLACLNNNYGGSCEHLFTIPLGEHIWRVVVKDYINYSMQELGYLSFECKMYDDAIGKTYTVIFDGEDLIFK